MSSYKKAYTSIMLLTVLVTLADMRMLLVANV
jgi:hypothetical protein